jgi:hypothetical protein
MSNAEQEVTDSELSGMNNMFVITSNSKLYVCERTDSPYGRLFIHNVTISTQQ